MSNTKRWKKTCILCSTSDPTISYFNFPANERRSEWLRLCNITWEIPRTAKLCAKHFSNECFTRNSNDLQQRRRLRTDAVPSQFLKLLIDENEIINDEDEGTSTSLLPYKWCFICGPVKDPQRSYHRFPKELHDQNVWLSKCGRRQSSSNNMNNVRLCNLHFSSNSFVENPQTRKRYLKRGAVPIDAKEVGSYSHENFDDDLVMEPTEETVTQVVEHTFASTSCMETPMEIVMTVGEIPLNSNLISEETSSSIQIEPQTSHKILIRASNKACQTEDYLLTAAANKDRTSHNAQPSVVVTPTTSNDHGDQLLDHSYVAPSTSTKVREPRYISEISTSHLVTPNGSKKCIEMCKRVIESKNKKIASLSRKLRYAQKKLKSMNDLIIHLEDTNYVSETASNDLLVGNAMLNSVYL